MVKFEWHLEGFLTADEYSFHFYEVFYDSKQLQGLENVIIYLKDDPIIGDRQPRNDSHKFSEDGNQCEIIMFFQSYYQQKGKMRHSTPADVFVGIRRFLEYIDKQHKEQFP